MDSITGRSPERTGGQGRPSVLPLRTQRPTMAVSLRRLLPQASFVGCGDVVAHDATEHSSCCTPGSVFAAIRGRRSDGAAFVGDALTRGASAVLTDRPLAETRVPQCIVPDVRKAYAELCHALFGYPSWRLGLAGVTGTNGKTTTTWLIRAMLESAGRPTGLLGTIEYSDSLERAPAELTTPDSRTLASWLASMVGRRATHGAMELSSHALEQHRAAGTLLDAAIVTNVTQDHFDYHETEAAYLAAKARILKMVKRGGIVVLNADDPLSAALAQEVPTSAHLQTFGLLNTADVSAGAVRLSPRGCEFRLTAGAETVEVHTRLPGRHNVSNCLAAAAAGLHFGLSLSEIADGLASLDVVPGRLEPVETCRGFSVLVDYAHTPDALSRVISAVRDCTPGRVFCVFGAGGDRDRSKRPLMAKAAALADVVVVTSDNPRSEDPAAIAGEIGAGFPSHCEPHVELDRTRAIGWALSKAQPGDCVLIAGKGHERIQIIGDQRIPFDDVAVCRRWLEQAPAHRLSPHCTGGRSTARVH